MSDCGKPDDGGQHADRERADEFADELDLAAVLETGDQTVRKRS